MVLFLCVNVDLGIFVDKVGGGFIKQIQLFRGKDFIFCIKKIIGYKVIMVDYGEVRVFQINVDFYIYKISNI